MHTNCRDFLDAIQLLLAKFDLLKPEVSSTQAALDLLPAINQHIQIAQAHLDGWKSYKAMAKAKSAPATAPTTPQAVSE